MISHLRGTLDFVSENTVEIDTGSLGFTVNVPTSVVGALPPIGEDIDLYTYMAVKEDDISLFGFLTRDALDMFKLLITVNGIGPKAALGILSAMTPQDIRLAVLSQDAKTLSKAPGIGTKTAQRMIIELKDKVSFEDALVPDASGFGKAAAPSIETPERNEAIEALVALGYSASDALRAVRTVDTDGKDTETILKEALKNIGR